MTIRILLRYLQFRPANFAVWYSLLMFLCLMDASKKLWAAESTPPLAAQTPTSTEEGYSLNYTIDTIFSYVTRLSNPLNLGYYDQPDIASSVVAPRTLGLTRLRVGLLWSLPHAARFQVVLRPDALLKTGDGDPSAPRREYDSRSGDPYEPRTEIQLLDAYQIVKDFGYEFDVALGVWELLAPRRTSYHPMLEFGLLVQLPEHFSGVNFGWKSVKRDLATAQKQTPSGYLLNLWVFQGSADRAERRTTDGDIYGASPTSDDSIYDMALGLVRVDRNFNQLGVLVGGGDHRVGQELSDDATPPGKRMVYGKRNDFYVQVFDQVQFKNLFFPTKASADLRYLKQKFKGDEINQVPRFHQSYSLTASSAVVADRHWVFYGVHWGRSKMSNTTTATGYQGDLGYQYALDSGLDLAASVTEERRTNSGGGSGSFNDNGNSRESLRRFGLEVRYVIN